MLRLEPVLQAMTRRGIPVSPAAHAHVTLTLRQAVEAVERDMQALVPDECKKLTKWKKKPNVRLPFKPSAQQLIAYMKFRKHPVPRAFKTDKETTAELELKRLAKSTKDPLYNKVIEYRELKTLLTNHVANWAPGPDGRVHPTFYYDTGTGQLGARRPNSMNAPKHKANQGDIFRSMIVAKEGHTLVECIAPETRILMHDLTWKRAGDILVDDELWGFDEFPVGKTKRPYCALHKSKVLGVRRLKKPTILVQTHLGAVICSTDHLWKRRTSCSPSWTRADKLKIGHKISFFVRPWDVDKSYDGGWLAGILDGEGYGGSKRQRGLHFGQKEGLISARAIAEFAKRGFKFAESGRTGLNKDCIQFSLKAWEPFEWLRCLGSLRPVRLLNRAMQDIDGMAHWGRRSEAAVVTAIVPMGEQEVIAIETTTHTFIAEGLLSHNCDYKAFHVQTLAFEARDSNLLRLAKRDIHSFLTAHFLRLPGADRLVAYGDEELTARLQDIKRAHKQVRDAKVKHALLGYNNGMGYRKCYYQYMEFFDGQNEAKRIFELLDSLFPRAKQYRQNVCDLAHSQGFLRSRFGCIRWFWEVYKWSGGKWAFGEDHEAALSFFTQNDAHCHLKEAMLRLSSLPVMRHQLVGDKMTSFPSPVKKFDAANKYGLINPIHDALMFECPDSLLAEAIPTVAAEMEKPSEVLIDPEVAPGGLSVEVGVSVGKQWNKMQEIDWRTYGQYQNR